MLEHRGTTHDSGVKQGSPAKRGRVAIWGETRVIGSFEAANPGGMTGNSVL